MDRARMSNRHLSLLEVVSGLEALLFPSMSMNGPSRGVQGLKTHPAPSSTMSKPGDADLVGLEG